MLACFFVRVQLCALEEGYLMIKKQCLFLIITVCSGLCLNASEMSDMSDKEFEALGTELGASQDANTPEMGDKQFEAFEKELFLTTHGQVSAQEDDVLESEELKEKEAELEDLVRETQELLEGIEPESPSAKDRAEKSRKMLGYMRGIIALFNKKVMRAVDDLKGKFNPEHLTRLQQLANDLDNAYNNAARLTDEQLQEMARKFIGGMNHIIFMIEQAGRYRGFNWIEIQKNKYKKMLDLLQKRTDEYEVTLTRYEKMLEERDAVIAESSGYREKNLELQQELDQVRSVAQESVNRYEDQIAREDVRMGKEHRQMVTKYEKMLDERDAVIAEKNTVIAEKDAIIAEAGRLYREEKLQLHQQYTEERLQLQQQLDRVREVAREVMRHCEERIAPLEDPVSIINDPALSDDFNLNA